MSKKLWLGALLVVLYSDGATWAQNYCYVLNYFNNSMTSIVSQSKKQEESMYWLWYDGAATSKLKYTFTFPKPVTMSKDVKSLSFNPPVTNAQVPFSFHSHESEALPRGPAVLKVTNGSSTCKYPVEVVDKGFESYGVPRNIPDADAAVADAGLVATGVDVIQKVRVSLYLLHPNVGDLEVWLIGPDGTSVLLSLWTGGAGDNYGNGFYHTDRTVFDDSASTSITAGVAPFVGTFMPYNSLAVFNGKSGSAANGLWKIRVWDDLAGNTGTVINWALMIDDAPGSKVTWYSSCLTTDMFVAAGYTPTAGEQAKLAGECYTLYTIIYGYTDRLVDTAHCPGCHVGFPSQTYPARYVPDYTQSYIPQATHYDTTGMNSTYAWADPTPNGIIAHFKTNPINKPAALKAIFQKWLDDGAFP